MIHFFYYRGPKRFQFTDIHLSALITAHTNGGFEKVILHEDTPGDSTFYQEARKLPYVEFRKTDFPMFINGYLIKDQRFPIDIVRLQTIIAEGGVTADLDFVFTKSFAPILHHDAFIGIQCNHKNKLCCAMMYSKLPQNPFYIAYLKEYQKWEPIHVKKFWIFANSIPYDLSILYPITVLPKKAFFPFAWSNKKFLQGHDIDFSDSYAVHLWSHLKPHLTLHDLQKTSLKEYLPEGIIRPPVSVLEGMTVSFD